MMCQKNYYDGLLHVFGGKLVKILVGVTDILMSLISVYERCSDYAI